MAKFSKKSKKYNYYDAFERQSEIAVEEAKLLMEVIESFTTAEDIKKYLPRAHELENKGDKVCHATFDAILPDFITPIDREDIVAMTNSLDEIIDRIEEVIQKFYIYDVHFMHRNAKPFGEMIVKSCEALCEAMADFRNCKKSKNFKSLIIQVNDIEDEADELYIKVIRNLYTHDRDNAVRVAVWDSIFNAMEDVIDKCEHTADLMNSIMLKNG